MNNEMIERCAKTAYEKDSLSSWDMLLDYVKLNLIEKQIAAIKAMREPTDKMVEAAFGKSDLTPHQFRTAWYSMIDAIIGDN